LSSPLQHLGGRIRILHLSCPIILGATIGQFLSNSVGQLAVCRAVAGLLLALQASTAPLLAAEVAPNHLRGKSSLLLGTQEDVIAKQQLGRILSLWPLSDAFGMLLGFLSNLAVLNLQFPDQTIWRIQLGTAMIPTIFLVWFMPFVPGKFSSAGS
jgi:MFS family permease